jgi:hypothetical protein
MKSIKKAGFILLVITLGMVTASASMVDQLIYNVAGQVTNAIGSRLGDEIYYGGSGRKATHRRRAHRRHHKKRHKKRRRSKKRQSVTSYKLTDQQKIQKALMSLGFYQGAIDGEVNSFETRAAIKALNNAYGIGNTASLTPEEKDSLIFLGTLFSYDRYLISNDTSEREKNKKIQVALKIHGFYHSTIDGALGSGSRRAIREYKMSKGLSDTASLDFEEEYQLISSAKQKNDTMLEDIINSLKKPGQHYPQAPAAYAQQQAPAAQRPYQSSQQPPVQSYQPRTSQTPQQPMQPSPQQQAAQSVGYTAPQPTPTQAAPMQAATAPTPQQAIPAKTKPIGIAAAAPSTQETRAPAATTATPPISNRIGAAE